MLRIENPGLGSQLTRIKMVRGVLGCLASLINPPGLPATNTEVGYSNKTKIRSAQPKSAVGAGIREPGLTFTAISHQEKVR